MVLFEEKEALLVEEVMLEDTLELALLSLLEALVLVVIDTF